MEQFSSEKKALGDTPKWHLGGSVPTAPAMACDDDQVGRVIFGFFRACTHQPSSNKSRIVLLALFERGRPTQSLMRAFAFARLASAELHVVRVALTTPTVNELVARINSKYGSPTESPVQLLYRNIPMEQLIALYRAADIMLVTPLWDGMNLVAKEYVAARTDN